MKKSETKIVDEILQKLLAHRTVDLQTGHNAEQYYYLDVYRNDIDSLNLKELETLKCKGPFTYQETKDHLSILNDRIDALSNRGVRSKANWALGISLISLLVACFK